MLKRLFVHYIAEEARPMLKLAIPLVMAELGWMTMAIVDTMMVGRQADSAEAIGAVSLGSILYNAVAIFGTGMMLGLDTLVSHSYGAGDVEDCHQSLVNGVYLTLGIAPLLMALVYFFEKLLHSLNIDPGVLGQALPYLRTLNWGTLPLLLFFVFRRYLQGMNLAKPIVFAIGDREPDESGWQLVVDLRAPGISRDGNGGLGLVHVYLARVHDAGAAGGSTLLRSSRFDGTAQRGEAAEFSARLEAGVSGTAGGDTVRDGSGSLRGGDSVDREARPGGAGKPPGGAEYREPHVYGAARDQRGRGGAGRRRR